jgi:predicted ribosome quality control (RQC) complex YloA/Tae2 family protein
MKMVSFEWKGVEYLFHIGRDKQDNWNLIEGSQPWDVWFHVDGAPSSHVVLEMDDLEGGGIKEIPRPVLKRGAGLCKEHSSSKSVAKCPVIYTTVGKLVKGREVGSVNISGEVRRLVL